MLVSIVIALLITLMVAYAIRELSPDLKFTNLALFIVLIIFLWYVSDLLGLV